MSTNHNGVQQVDPRAGVDDLAVHYGFQAPEKKPKPAKKVSSGNLLQDLIEIYKDDPVGFARDILGREPFPWQAELMTAVARGERQISVRAGHGVGKTACCGMLALWFLYTKYPQKTIVTAPAAGQMLTGFLPEIKSMVRDLSRRFPELGALVEVKSESIVLKADPDGSLLAARTASADRPEALSGVHSENVLLIVDEAVAVPDVVYKNAAGSMSGKNACTILISNPVRSSGYFYKTHNEWAKKHKDDAGGWHTMQVSCEDQPIVDKSFVEKIIKSGAGTTPNTKSVCWASSRVRTTTR
ncbi:DEAD/DEAH box helicase family protein [Micromonospora sp. STR1s_5]|nr:DEAD/DEAH box helicase family protein [Micromonospora sp. STR1s_5]